MRERILAVIEKNSRISTAELAEILGENEAAVHLHWRQQMRCGCWKIQSTRSYHRKGLHQFCGKTVSGQKKPRKL